MREAQGRRQVLNRFFYRAGQWYVEVREGCLGPFLRRDEAAAHLERHIRRNAWNRADFTAAGQVTGNRSSHDSTAG